MHADRSLPFAFVFQTADGTPRFCRCPNEGIIGTRITVADPSVAASGLLLKMSQLAQPVRWTSNLARAVILKIILRAFLNAILRTTSRKPPASARNLSVKPWLNGHAWNVRQSPVSMAYRTGRFSDGKTDRRSGMVASGCGTSAS